MDPETENNQIEVDDFGDFDNEESGSEASKETPAHESSDEEDSNKQDDVSEESDDESDSGEEEDESSDENEDSDKSGEDDSKQEESNSELDDDLDQWAVKKGYAAPTTELEKKLLQQMRDNDRKFHAEKRKTKEVASELQDSIDGFRDESANKDEGVEALRKELQKEKNIRLQSEFYTANNVSDDEHKAMVDLINKSVSELKTVKEKEQELDYWSNPRNLSKLLKLAKAELGDITSDLQVDKAKQEERNRIAKEQGAPGVPASAKATKTKPKKDLTDPAAWWE